MTTPEKITSLQNPKIKNLKKLEKASERREQNLILIEGMRETVLAHRAGYVITSLFICEEILKEDERYNLKTVMTAGSGISVFHISKEVYDSLAYRETTEGVIATARPGRHRLDKIKLGKNPLILVIEGVEKPGNLGAMLRTCDAANVDAVIICDGKTDVYNPNVMRSSLGTVFTQQVIVCETQEAIEFLKANDVKIFAAELTGAQLYFAEKFKQPSAVVVGTEATGLSAAWINAADARIKIPMLGEIDSLNVSVSAAVLLFEAVRQRTQFVIPT
jgi:TrmH family RNA methyltransferase